MDCGRYGKKKKNGYLGKVNSSANWLSDKTVTPVRCQVSWLLWQLAGAMLTYNIDTNIVHYHAKNFSLPAIENIKLACQLDDANLVFGRL